MARQVYRKTLLERISSPEQLDKMIVITSPSYWLAILGGAFIIVAALVWSILGSIPINMETTGIFVSAQMSDQQTADSQSIGEQQVICYVPISSGKKIVPGMEAVVCPTTVNQQEYGNMMGEVVAVDPYVTSYEDIVAALGSESLAQMFSQNGPVVAVTCKLRTDATTVSGFWWSNDNGATVVLAEGTIMIVDIILEEKSPISMLLPFVNDSGLARAEQDSVTE